MQIVILESKVMFISVENDDVFRCMDITLPETNVAPESLGLEDVYSFLLAGAMLVLGRVDKVAVFYLRPTVVGVQKTAPHPSCLRARICKH